MTRDIDIHWEFEIIGFLHDVMIWIFEGFVKFRAVTSTHWLATLNIIFSIEKCPNIINIIHFVENYFSCEPMVTRETTKFFLFSVFNDQFAILYAV